MYKTNNNHLQRNLSILFSATIIPSIVVIWIGYEINDFDPIPWLTLIIGSVFGLAITIIVSSKSENILNQLKKSEEDKTEFAKFILISNYSQLRKITINYFETIGMVTISTNKKKSLFKTILPSIISFLNICETVLPNTGDQLTKDDIAEINNRFTMLHKLIILLESGSENIFEQNISNLNQYTDSTLQYLEKLR